MYACMHVRMYACRCVGVYVCMYVCMCVCMCIYIYTHTQTHTHTHTLDEGGFFRARQVSIWGGKDHSTGGFGLSGPEEPSG